MINGFEYPRQDKECASTFGRSSEKATRAFHEDPLMGPLIPNWNRVESALPEFLGELREAVQKDNA